MRGLERIASTIKSPKERAERKMRKYARRCCFLRIVTRLLSGMKTLRRYMKAKGCLFLTPSHRALGGV